MSELYYYEFSTGNTKKTYSIDSNVLISMAKLYYKGHCHDEAETRAIQDFLINKLKTQPANMIYDNAILETCFNYNNNRLETAALNGYMLAIDWLVYYSQPNELFSISGTFNSELRFDNSCSISSILGCNIANYLGKNYPLPNKAQLFNLMYLYNLKLLEIFHDRKLKKIEKIQYFYSFMAKDIDCISTLHLILAQMLFVGEDAEEDIAQKILKPKNSYTIRDFINSTIDMFHVYSVFILQNALIQCNEENDCILVTQDIGMIGLCSVIEKTFLILGSDSNAVLCQYMCQVKPKHAEKWSHFYEQIEQDEKIRVLNNEIEKKRYGISQSKSNNSFGSIRTKNATEIILFWLLVCKK